MSKVKKYHVILVFETFILFDLCLFYCCIVLFLVLLLFLLDCIICYETKVVMNEFAIYVQEILKGDHNLTKDNQFFYHK